MPPAVLTAAVGLATAIGSYVLGRRQHVDKLRVEQALPRTEKIAALVQEIRDTEMSLASWWHLNFDHLSLTDGLDAFERHGIYDPTREEILRLRRTRSELAEALRSGRTYLNASDLDRIGALLKLGNFEFSDDGFGGALFFTGYWSGFWSNLLDKSRDAARAKLYRKVKSRLNRMHQLGWMPF